MKNREALCSSATFWVILSYRTFPYTYPDRFIRRLSSLVSEKLWLLHATSLSLIIIIIWKKPITLRYLFWGLHPPPPPPPHWAKTSSLTKFQDHTRRRATLGRTPLDEWPGRRRDLYLTAHNTHKRQRSMPRWDSNPQSQWASGRRPTS
jgi:hypothetical protein